MAANPLDGLLELGGVLIVALAGALIVLRVSRRGTPAVDGLVVGYPPDLFPARAIVQQPALQALAATQHRLLAVYRRLLASGHTRPVNDMTIWLRVFLIELRTMMDTAYRVAVITDVYRDSDHLDRLAQAVRRLEAQIADEITHQLLAHDGRGRNEQLSRSLASLRRCAEELAGLAAPRVD